MVYTCLHSFLVLKCSFVLSDKSKANISETLNKKGQKCISMNYKEIRNKLTASNPEKLKLLNSEYLDATIQLFKTIISEEDLVMNLQIIATLTLTRDSDAKSRIRDNLDVYFAAVEKYVERVVVLFNEKNDTAIEIFDKSLFNVSNNQYDFSDYQNNSDEVPIKMCDWRAEKKEEKAPDRINMKELQTIQTNTADFDNRFVIVDIENNNPNIESSVQYVYDEINNRFILHAELTHNLDEDSGPIILQAAEESVIVDIERSSDLGQSTPDVSDAENLDVTEATQLDGENREANTSPSLNNEMDESVLDRNIIEDTASQNESAAIIQNRGGGRDSELIRLIDYFHSIRGENRTHNTRSMEIEDADQHRSYFINSSSNGYSGVHGSIENAMEGDSRLTTEEIDIISSRFNDYRQGNSFLLALEREFADDGINQTHPDNLEALPGFTALNETSVLDAVHGAYTAEIQSDRTAVQCLTTPLPNTSVTNTEDDLSILDSHNIFLSDDKSQDNESNTQLYVNMKSQTVYKYPSVTEQDVFVAITRSIFSIVKSTSFFSDEILFFLLWLLKSNNLAFLDAYHRNLCVKDACHLLKYYMIRKKTIRVIEVTDYIKDFELNEFNIKAYKLLITKNNVKYVNYEYFQRFIYASNNGYNLDFIECYIEYVRHIDKDKKQMHYDSIVNILKKTINKNINRSMFLVSKFALHAADAQNICGKKGVIEIVVSKFMEQTRLSRNPQISILCMYSLCDAWEQNRKLIVKHRVMPIIFEIFKQKLKSKNFDKVFLACVCLIKCMTRCVQFLKSELFDFPIIELFFLVIKYASKVKNSKDLEILSIFECCDAREIELCSFRLLKESFAVLSNLVMDHGNHKVKFISRDGLQQVYRIGKKSNLEFYMLFLLKNFLYESVWTDKELFMEVCKNRRNINCTPSTQEKTKKLTHKTQNSYLRGKHVTIESFVAKCIENIEKSLCKNRYYIQTNNRNIFTRTFLKYNRVNLNNTSFRTQIKLKTVKELFNIIRNMVCATKYEVYKFLSSYPALLGNTVLYFIRVLRSISFDLQKRNIIIEILYTFSNICASTDEYKEIFLKPFFMTEIKKLFEVKNRDIVLAMVWFITNLSWIEDESGYERNKRMIEYGYKRYLLNVQNIDPYIKDKVAYAMENLNA